MSEQRDGGGEAGNDGGNSSAGGAWGSRGEDAAWWPASADQQALLSEEVRNAAAQHIFSYKMAGGFQAGEGATGYECRPEQAWWYGGANVLADHHQHQSEQTNQQSAQASLVQAQQQHAQQQALQAAALQQHALQQQALQAAALAGAGAGAAVDRRANAKPRGRMTAYAFFVQTCREEHKRKHPEEIVVFAAFSKKCAERWNTMSEKEKQRFHEMAEQDKKRYDLEMRHYIPPRGEKLRGRKRRQAKDPNAPKRSLSAFFWFCNDERAKVKAINPDYGVGDIAKELGRRWAATEPATKAKYDAMSEKDKARYDREMTAYKKRPLLQEQGLEEEDGSEARNHEYE